MTDLTGYTRLLASWRAAALRVVTQPGQHRATLIAAALAFLRQHGARS